MGTSLRVMTNGGWTMCDIELITPNETILGQGVLEQLIAGPHAPSGFKEMSDMAP